MKRRAFVQSAAATLATASAWPLQRALAQAAAGLKAAGDITARRLNGGETTIPKAAVDELAASLRGVVLLPGGDDYERARHVWNGLFDRRPALIAKCMGAADVRTAVSFARSHDLLLAVKGGGHSLSGQSTCDGGLMIDLSPMRTVRVDPVARRAYVGPGTLLGDLDLEAQAFGLITTAGTVSHTGAAGLTLGGGQGRLMRLHGLACDNLRAAEVITAKGEFVRASEKENPDLFWALRGGGGNFGVVTEFEYQLHPFDGTVLGGHIVYPYEQARDAYEFYAEFTRNMPDPLHLEIALASPDGGKPVVAVEVCYAGKVEDGERAIAPLRAFGKPLKADVGPIPYRKLQTSSDVSLAPGQNYYLRGGYVRELTPALFDAILANFEPSKRRVTVMNISRFGGAMGRVPEDATAYPGRKAGYDVLLITAWGDPTSSDDNLAAARGIWGKLGEFTKGFYINITAGGDEDRLRANWGGHYDRLVQVKTKYDPGNLFRLNPNIKPLAG
jgi:hypothetical protein